MTTLVARKRAFYKPCKKRQLISITIALGSILLINSSISYKALLNNFDAAFNDGDFDGASILIDQEHYNPIKQLFITKDLTNILDNKLSLIPKSLESNEITYENAENLIEQIKKFDLVNERANSLLESFPQSTAAEGIQEEAISTENTAIDASSTNTDTSSIKICKENINNLAIGSKTPYLLYVDLENQKTFVYKGKKDNWNLIKEFSCSSGIKGDETPKGYYTVKQKGNWFFSQKYNEGAKYWVQFDGNYLFHSFPIAKDKSTILDKTLGKPASHGCVRLSMEDSKWLFDTIPSDSKILIH